MRNLQSVCREGGESFQAFHNYYRALDREVRIVKEYDDFGEAYAVLIELEKTIGGFMTNQLSASSLKNALWETLNDLKAGKIQSPQADGVATQAREILRTVKVQLNVAAQSKRSIPVEVIEFSEK